MSLRRPAYVAEADLSVLICGISARPSAYPWRGLSAAAQGKFVTFGVTRGCIAVASPVSSITWLIAPRSPSATVIMS